MSHSSVYTERRARLAKAIGPRGIAIIPTAPEQQRNRDSDFPYRADSYFYYLTGFTEPHAWLVVIGDGRSTLFCQPKDRARGGNREAQPGGRVFGHRPRHPNALADGQLRCGVVPVCHP